MRNTMQRLGRLLALTTVVLAVAAPAASARHAADYFQTNPAPAYSAPAGYVPSPAQSPVIVSGDGFDWGDAGIGATAVLALAAITAGALITVRHRPGHGRLA